MYFTLLILNITVALKKAKVGLKSQKMCHFLWCTKSIYHFTVVVLVSWPLSESEAAVDLVYDADLGAFQM